MKKQWLIGLLFVFGLTLQAQTVNKALYLDGDDNNVRIGMTPLTGNWTLEAWIKGNEQEWQEEAVIIGGGEYSDSNTWDNKPLQIHKGRLFLTKANLFSPDIIDHNWHHVAATSDGRSTRLYLDGKEIASADTAYAIVPGTIGTHDYKLTFGGLIDEVRIWDSALTSEAINDWKDRSIEPLHPFFSSLKGYYNFDDFDYDYAINRVGQGPLSFHVRNGRNDFYKNKLMAYTVDNENPLFKTYQGKQQLFNAVVIHSEWDADQGAQDDQILKLRIAVDGKDNPLHLQSITLDLSGTTSLKDIENVHLYYTGSSPRSKDRKELFGKGKQAQNTLTFEADKEFPLSEGINYFLVTFDISAKAVPGNRLHASVRSFQLGKKKIIPQESNDYIPKLVTLNSRNSPDILKVLQWNIWHAGLHLGEKGRQRTLELIQASNADIITLQEGYGSQDTLATAMGYYLQTEGPKENLAFLSRYPIEKISTQKTFNSNPGKVTLPNGKRILINDCWLRYAYQPEYTCCYFNTGLDPDIWIKEDAERGLEDARLLIENDINPYMESEDMPVIIGGDFNSCSHLDWTEAAKGLHNGYGPVDLPISRFMYHQGYKDSFREIHTDEVAYQGGTFAVIFGQLQHSRIDFLYYKGAIRPLYSKIIRTAPEIDDVWPSDHAAVITVFQVE